MSSFHKVDLPNDFVVEVVGEKVIDDEDLKNQVEMVWNSELKLRQGKLDNDLITHFISFDDKTIAIEMVEYKYYLAALKKPLLKDKLNIHPISVSGFTHAGSHILLGVRGLQVSQYPGFYEFVPSGSLDEAHRMEDRMQVRGQVFDELREEAGIQSSAVDAIGPWLLIHDKESGIYEICAKISVDPHRISTGKWETSGEYKHLMWLTKEEIIEHITHNHQRYVPLSRQLFSFFIHRI